MMSHINENIWYLIRSHKIGGLATSKNSAKFDSIICFNLGLMIALAKRQPIL